MAERIPHSQDESVEKPSLHPYINIGHTSVHQDIDTLEDYLYLKKKGKTGCELVPVNVHTSDDYQNLIKNGHKRQFLLVNDFSDGEAEKIVSFADPTIKLANRHGFSPEGIIWLENKPTLPSTK